MAPEGEVKCEVLKLKNEKPNMDMSVMDESACGWYIVASTSGLLRELI